MLERELVKAVLADEASIALTGHDRAVRSSVLDRAEPLLAEQHCRIVRIRSQDGQPLDLRSAMNQVVGDGSGGADRVERFFGAIALPLGQERHIVLLVDDTQFITSDLLNYLALIGSTTVGQDRRLQIVFAGDPAMWDTLPRAGNLASDRIVTRIVVGQPVPKPEPLPVSELPPTFGHEGLRDHLAQRHRRRLRIGLFTSRLMARVLTTAFVLTVAFATVVLWARLPGLRAAVGQ